MPASPAAKCLRRLQLCGENHCAIDAILITHEHSDHVAGIRVLARKLKIPIYITARDLPGLPTQRARREWASCCPRSSRTLQFRQVVHRSATLPVTPFTIPHDAVDPVGFTFRSEGIKVGICTDLGYMPPNVRDHLRGCHLLMIESNHDLELLRSGPYPWSVKQRVMSRVGHLSNDALADFLTSDYDGEAEFLILAHLSEQNNHPEIARMTAERALGQQRSLFLQNRLMLATQHEPLSAVRL